MTANELLAGMKKEGTANKEDIELVTNTYNFFRQEESHLHNLCEKYSKEMRSKLSELSNKIEKMHNNSEEVEKGNMPLKIALIGDFNAGKSTFINSLLAEDILPIGDLPLTKIVTKVKYGDGVYAIAYYKDKNKKHKKMNIEEFKKINSLSYDDYGKETEEKIDCFELFYQCDRLRHINFIDTPGFGRADIIKEEKDLELLTNIKIEEADLIFYLLRADCFTDTQLKIIEEIKGKPIMLIYNIDYGYDGIGRETKFKDFTNYITKKNLKENFEEIIPYPAEDILKAGASIDEKNIIKKELPQLIETHSHIKEYKTNLLQRLFGKFEKIINDLFNKFKFAIVVFNKDGDIPLKLVDGKSKEQIYPPKENDDLKNLKIYYNKMLSNLEKLRNDKIDFLIRSIVNRELPLFKEDFNKFLKNILSEINKVEEKIENAKGEFEEYIEKRFESKIPSLIKDEEKTFSNIVFPKIKDFVYQETESNTWGNWDYIKIKEIKNEKTINKQIFGNYKSENFIKEIEDKFYKMEDLFKGEEIFEDIIRVIENSRISIQQSIQKFYDYFIQISVMQSILFINKYVKPFIFYSSYSSGSKDSGRDNMGVQLADGISPTKVINEICREFDFLIQEEIFFDSVKEILIPLEPLKSNCTKILNEKLDKVKSDKEYIKKHLNLENDNKNQNNFIKKKGKSIKVYNI